MYFFPIPFGICHSNQRIKGTNYVFLGRLTNEETALGVRNDTENRKPLSRTYVSNIVLWLLQVVTRSILTKTFEVVAVVPILKMMKQEFPSWHSRDESD